MKEFKYILEKGSKKFSCPDCERKSFVRYIDTQTGGYLPERYGRCDHESKCGYFLNPYKDGYAKAIREQEQGNKTDWKPQHPKLKKKPLTKPKRAFIPIEVFNHTRSGYEQNVFIQNLLQSVAFPFEVQDIEEVISLYHLGTVANGYRAGAVTFPFIDENNNIRAIQVKQFDKANHTTGTDFLHSIIEKYYIRNNKPLPEWLEAYNKNETKVSCLFGEHLLSKYPRNPVALVEAPKTAIYGTLYFGAPKRPTDFIWLAVYNMSSFSLDKMEALKGRTVSVFPDLSKDGRTFEKWKTKAQNYEKQLPGTRFIFSDLLEQLATENDKHSGKDIADYLIKQDWRLFRKQPTPELFPEEVKNIQPPFAIPIEVKPIQPKNWSNDITELKAYFAGITLPVAPVKLNAWTTIIVPQLFVSGSLATIKSHSGNRRFLPYLNELKNFKSVIFVNK